MRYLIGNHNVQPGITPRKWFLFTALLFGLVYALLVPPFQAPDETSHFFRAFHLSEGHLMGITTADNRLGGYLPASLQAVYRPFAGLRYNYSARISPDSLLRAAAIPLNSGERDFIDFANVGYYAPFPYVPYALVFTFLRPFHLAPLFLLFAGRIAGLLFWVGVVYLAIRRLPYHRWTMAFCMLLPASLFLHSSLSGDTVMNALAFYLLARLLGLIFDERRLFSAREGIVLLVISGLITASKVVFAPLIALVLFMPQAKFGSGRRRRLWCCGLLLFNLIILAAWYHYAGGKFIPYDNYNPAYRDGQQINPGVAPFEQLAFIFRHPLEYFAVLAHSFFESLPATMAHYAGKFGWEKNYLPGPLIGMLLPALIILGFFENRTGPAPETKHRLAFAAIAVIMSIALATVLYLQWHAVGASRITALQGRYFFSILPLLWLALKQQKWHLPQFWLQRGAMLLSLVALIWGCVAVAERYYYLGIVIDH